jgi:hypothetical protein
MQAGCSACGPTQGVPFDPWRKRPREFVIAVARRVEYELPGGHFAALAVFVGYPFVGDLMRQLSRLTKDEAILAVVDANISDLAWDEAARRFERELHADAQDDARAGRGRRPYAA